MKILKYPQFKTYSRKLRILRVREYYVVNSKRSTVDRVEKELILYKELIEKDKI